MNGATERNAVRDRAAIAELRARLVKLHNQPDRHAGRAEEKMNEMDVQLVEALLKEAQEKLRSAPE